MEDLSVPDTVSWNDGVEVPGANRGIALRESDANECENDDSGDRSDDATLRESHTTSCFNG